jgi:hypothetical protein
MWFRRHTDHPHRFGRYLEPSIIDRAAEHETEARLLLDGRVVDRLWAQGQPIPGWAWLNALAHRPAGEIGDLLGVACDQPGDCWADAVVDIALLVSQTAPAEAAHIQAEVFVAFELEARADRTGADGPDQLARAVRRHLANPGQLPLRNRHIPSRSTPDLAVPPHRRTSGPG